MKQFLKQWIGVIFAVASFAAPAPYPLTINSRSQTAPPVTAYRGNEMTYRVSFVDGSTSSAIADDETPFMSWATNASAGVIGTSIYSRVSGQTGVVDFTFSPSVLNYDQGRYIYEAGVISANGNYMVYRQGTFSIYASPVGGGANPFIGTSNIIWEMYNWLGIPDWITADDLPDYSDMTAHTEDTGNPHGVTAAQIGAITAEQDLAALRAYHYGSPDIVESPAEWFRFDSGTITGFNWEAGRTNVVIPWAIGGVPVTAIGENASRESGIVSVIAPQTVTSIRDSAFYNCSALTSINLPQATSIGDYAFYNCSLLASINLPQVTSIGVNAFYYCELLASVSLPQATSIGDYAFANCDGLTSVSLPQATAVVEYAFAFCSSLASIYFDGNAPTIESYIFEGLAANQATNYVTNPQATGWGEKLGDMPVVRMPLYADAIYQAGELVATTGHVAQAIAAIEFPVTSTNYTAWTGTITPADGTATVTIAHGNMPVLVTSAPCVLTLDPTGYGTAGVSRVSLSYYTGTNSFTFATNFISYAATPTVDTNGWNSLLIRRVSNGTWKGVGL